jgi:ATP-dependent protease La (LON) substrate-binding domain
MATLSRSLLIFGLLMMVNMTGSLNHHHTNFAAARSLMTTLNGVRRTTVRRLNALSMQWIFGRQPGSTGTLKDIGIIGSQGELYFMPSTKPRLKAPDTVVKKEQVLALFPRNQVLGPMGEEYLGIYEMRYRQLINDIGENGVFGHIYYSQENSKLGLVGTLTRVKRVERLEDGGMYVLMEGIGRFYIKEVVAEKPYLRARVQVFTDFSENEAIMESLEAKVLDEVRYSVKMMTLLYPTNNYTMNSAVLKYRPLVKSPTLVDLSNAMKNSNIGSSNANGGADHDDGGGYVEGDADDELPIRYVSLPTDVTDMQRRSRFAFAVMDILKTDPVTKLLFLQEPIIEQRYIKILKVI